MGFKATEENISVLGMEYFRAFAENEGLIFDIHGYPHPHLRGRPITKGQFTAEAKEKLMQWWGNHEIADTLSPDDHPAVLDLSSRIHVLFNAQTNALDFNTVVDITADLANWKRLRRAMGECLEQLKGDQQTCNHSFGRHNFGGSSEDNKIRHTIRHSYASMDREDMDKAIKTIKDIVSSLNIATKQDKLFIDEFLANVELSFAISRAKAFYIRLKNISHPDAETEKRKQELLQWQNEANAICKDRMKGSDLDCEKINAEIMSGPSLVKSKWYGDEFTDQVYYYPEKLDGYLKIIDQIIDRFDQKQKREEHVSRRIRPSRAHALPESPAP